MSYVEGVYRVMRGFRPGRTDAKGWHGIARHDLKHVVPGVSSRAGAKRAGLGVLT